MAILKMDVIVVKNILEMPLSIPDYQRPYKWQSQHVNQLLDDIILYRNKVSYRLGTVVLHQDDSESKALQFIVDGQQRLLTLTLLCSLLDKDKLCHPYLLQQNFNSDTTIRNIERNSFVINSRIKQLSEVDKEDLLDFILHKCQFICVTLNDLSEAFQFFDSQNARGKELEPYDLLKAFHLREMSENSEVDQIKCVENWERSVSPDNDTPSLHLIMSDVLFRMRRWSTGQPAIYFTRKYINVFKGVNLRANPYRFTGALRAVDYIVDQYNADAIRHWDQQRMPYPFLVDQTIINGKRFFEYIQYYIGLYQTLFIDKKQELSELLEVINNYEGKHRTGDHYVRNLFYCSVLFYYDKFGDVELEKASKICFIWSYRIRLEQIRVVTESIDNTAKEDLGLFYAIKQALHPTEVLAFTVEPLNETQIKGTKVDRLVAKFIELGYLNNVN